MTRHSTLNPKPLFTEVLAANDESRQLQTGEAAEAERESESEVQDGPGKLDCF